MAISRKADVVVADAQPVARAGLVYLINSDSRLRVCAETGEAARVRALCEEHRPQVLVLDPAMGDGFTLIKDVPRWSRGTRTVVFTALNDSLAVQRAFKAGASGFVSRFDPVSALFTAILAALEGKRHVGPEIEHLQLENLACGSVELRGNEVAGLSDRELQVFRLIGGGLSTRGVAERLMVSVKTVETHRERIKGKMGLANGAELQRRAVLFHGNAAAPGAATAQE